MQMMVQERHSYSGVRHLQMDGCSKMNWSSPQSSKTRIMILGIQFLFLATTQ